MFKRLRQFLRHNYFGRQFPLDYRIYMIFFFKSYLISILSAITSAVLQKGLPGLILQGAYIAFCTAMLFVMPRIRLKLEKPHLLFITFIYIPFLYFQTAGYHGTALMFAPLGLFLLSIVFTGRARLLILGLNILNYLACILVSWLYPRLVIPHGSAQDMFADRVVASVLSFVGLCILTVYISKVFEEHHKTLSELSIRDALTGAYNRRFMADFLEGQMETARQAESTFCLLMMDIDHFKKINDAYGHTFGDHVLLACVQAVKSVLRKGDMVARYGGEEFVIVLPPQIPGTAAALAERIRQAVAQLRFSHDIRVTVSIGAARYRPDDTVESLIHRADLRLYEAKRLGRNRVVHSSIA